MKVQLIVIGVLLSLIVIFVLIGVYYSHLPMWLALLLAVIGILAVGWTTGTSYRKPPRNGG